jgi:hypothetical protein
MLFSGLHWIPRCQPKVASLGVEDIGQVSDVVLPAVVAATVARARSDGFEQSVTSAGCPETAKTTGHGAPPCSDRCPNSFEETTRRIPQITETAPTSTRRSTEPGRCTTPVAVDSISSNSL